MKCQIQSFTEPQSCISTILMCSDRLENQLCAEGGVLSLTLSRRLPSHLWTSRDYLLMRRIYPLVMPGDSGMARGSMELLWFRWCKVFGQVGGFLASARGHSAEDHKASGCAVQISRQFPGDVLLRHERKTWTWTSSEVRFWHIEHPSWLNGLNRLFKTQPNKVWQKNLARIKQHSKVIWTLQFKVFPNGNTTTCRGVCYLHWRTYSRCTFSFTFTHHTFLPWQCHFLWYLSHRQPHIYIALFNSSPFQVSTPPPACFSSYSLWLVSIAPIS